MASLCHPWFTTTNLSSRFPILKLPPPPCAVLLVLENWGYPHLWNPPKGSCSLSNLWFLGWVYIIFPRYSLPPRAGPRHKTFARRISDDRISERAWMDISPKIAGENVEWWGAACNLGSRKFRPLHLKSSGFGEEPKMWKFPRKPWLLGRCLVLGCGD